MATAFAGLRVLDAARDMAGALAAMLLADFGAEVLRLDDGAPPRSPAAIAWNRNKHRHHLDIEDPDRRADRDVLIAGADVIVLDGGPRRLERLDLTPDSLCDRWPRLIPLWTPPYGVQGEMSELPARHGVLMGLGGAAFRQGAWRDVPVWHVTSLAHYAQATLAATAVSAAVLARVRDGKGRSVTVSGLHALAQLACPLAPAGDEGLGRGSPLGDAPNYRLYRCGDGQWLFLGTLFPHFFARAAEALGLDGAELTDPGRAIAARLSSAPRAHWLDLFAANDVPAGPVERREQWLEHPILRDNDLAVQAQHPKLGRVRMPGMAARLEATPGAVRHFEIEAAPEILSRFRDASAGTSASPFPSRASDLPLAGLRVLDLGTVVAGAYCGAILANFGADVIKIEPAEGDPFRFAVTGFINCNRGKRGLGLDLKTPAGRELFLELARGADVVLDNYRLGVRERLGVDAAALARVNPRIVSCAITAFGSRGAHAPRPGFDPLIQALSGMMAAQGGDECEPVFHTIPVNDVAAAALSAFAIVAALVAREATGTGQAVETSLAGASAFYQFAELTDFANRPAAPAGGRDCLGFSAVQRFYPCADGWLSIACETPHDIWRLKVALCLGGDGPESDVSTFAGDGALGQRIAAILAERSRAEALAALWAAGVPAGPVHRPAAAQRSAQLWDNAHFALHHHPRWGPLVGARGYAAFDGETPAFTRLEPDLGAHGPEVLFEAGLDRDRILALARAGVIFRQ